MKNLWHILWRKVKKHQISSAIYKLVFSCLGFLPVKKNLVMFESYLGKQYSCNPRAIYEYLKENNPEYDLRWSVDKRYLHNFKEKDVTIIKRFSIQWFFGMARARYWVNNSRLPLWITRPKHTIYIQTWHGTPLKRLALDMDEVYMPGVTTEKYKKEFISETQNWNYLISPNEYSSRIFRRAFHFQHELLETGYPRNDYLYNCNNEKTINHLKDNYGIPKNKKVILYAPTWRDNQFYDVGKYKFDLELDLQLMKDKLGDQYIIILRMHYLVAEKFDLSKYKNFVFDFSNHEDIRELYIISDMLITDYSSVFFDYANLKRPILFYVYDIDEYRDKLRGFYFDFEKNAPGPLLKTTSEIVNSIKQLEEQNFSLPNYFQSFYNKFCYLENGDSSRLVVEKLFK
ncbi:CDP-glycerol:poly(glycerophosphate) glycerophosphotransferase [Heyndrickxia sporothermodurans]|uniref:CDP-glycerol:poly(Glycerophosphate) glycerophosphotransferase n=1 Tax=Heyndrickxia sporothermodurans TaxID=46224 RepID=A0A150LB46_9BACI|nr:CDP-glycerol:poly(glycerophosphate) glycerophosphotransferase [Heyndrickxia sporothermodurans]